MRIGIIAPALAMRAGLRALLTAETSVQAKTSLKALPSSDEISRTVHVVLEAASLGELPAEAEQIDVLLITAEAASPLLLRQALANFAQRSRSEEGSLALVLLTDDRNAAQGLGELPLRAWGILPLDSSAEELQAAVRAVHEGLLVVAPALLGSEVGAGSAFSRLLEIRGKAIDALIEHLTEREGEVLQLLGRGLANKQIAVELGISEHTVKFHISSIFSKLSVTSRTEAVRAGIQRGLVIL